MQIELACPCCSYRFAAPGENTSATATLDRMTHNGAWYFLGEGDTLEDMIFATLTGAGDITCPECAAPVLVTEESLGQMAMEMLNHW
jgi:hypothetical protein